MPLVDVTILLDSQAAYPISAQSAVRILFWVNVATLLVVPGVAVLALPGWPPARGVDALTIGSTGF